MDKPEKPNASSIEVARKIQKRTDEVKKGKPPSSMKELDCLVKIDDHLQAPEDETKKEEALKAVKHWNEEIGVTKEVEPNEVLTAMKSLEYNDTEKKTGALPSEVEWDYARKITGLMEDVDTGQEVPDEVKKHVDVLKRQHTDTQSATPAEVHDSAQALINYIDGTNDDFPSEKVINIMAAVDELNNNDDDVVDADFEESKPTRRCLKCGADLPADAIFCPKCKAQQT